MSRRRLSLALATGALASAAALPAAAAAEVGHTVQPGETLWSIAAANNLTTRTVAAYNGVSEDSNVVLGSTVRVPTTVEGAAALQGTGVAPAATGDGAATPASAPETTTTASPQAPEALGGYTVRAGDTLSGLASGAGVPVSQLAAANGLAADAQVIAGTVLKLPTGAPAPAQSDEPEPEATVVPAADPQPTATSVGASDIQSIASAAGVSPSLAAAIGWQESGFNNDAVSSANARGVMQVMPGTWSYIQDNLAARELDPSSATDNVTAGVLYLKQLLADTGGDENTAIAGYYQGLGAVRERGLYDDTKQYVANVQALRRRFGG